MGGCLDRHAGWFPLRDPRTAHQPEPIEHDRLAMVGDYLFDSTLNVVLRSAEIATDLVWNSALHVEKGSEGFRVDSSENPSRPLFDLSRASRRSSRACPSRFGPCDR